MLPQQSEAEFEIITVIFTVGQFRPSVHLSVRQSDLRLNGSIYRNIVCKLQRKILEHPKILQAQFIDVRLGICPQTNALSRDTVPVDSQDLTNNLRHLGNAVG